MKKTIGQIATLMLTHCTPAAIENSMCECLTDLHYGKLINMDDMELFGVVISGWQAVGNPRPAEVFMTDREESRVTEIAGYSVVENWNTFIPASFEEKKQWLINLAVCR
jgi:hypothetical protein